MALATGLIQPGSSIDLSHGKKFGNKGVKVNNVNALKQKLQVLRNSLAWEERLDLTISIVSDNSWEHRQEILNMNAVIIFR